MAKLFSLPSFAISNEFYYFLIFLTAFNIYIFCTLQYSDDLLCQLKAESIAEMSAASFEAAISKLSPHFSKFEKNCNSNYENYTLETWSYVTSVLNMDWQFRLIYLFVFYQIALYLENRYQCKMTKFISNHLITTATQQTIKYKLLSRFCKFVANSGIYFCFCMLDVEYTRWRFTDQNAQSMDAALMDYSQQTVYEKVVLIIYMFVRVHPTDSWLVRISHGLSYPFTIYALTRHSISEFIFCHMLSIAFWAFHIGGLCHTLDRSDMHLRCVRRSFIWSVRGSSVTGEAIRQSVAPYLNLVCLTIDCAKYLL